MMPVMHRWWMIQPGRILKILLQAISRFVRAVAEGCRQLFSPLSTRVVRGREGETRRLRAIPTTRRPGFLLPLFHRPKDRVGKNSGSVTVLGSDISLSRLGAERARAEGKGRPRGASRDQHGQKGTSLSLDAKSRPFAVPLKRWARTVALLTVCGFLIALLQWGFFAFQMRVGRGDRVQSTPPKLPINTSSATPEAPSQDRPVGAPSSARSTPSDPAAPSSQAGNPLESEPIQASGEAAAEKKDSAGESLTVESATRPPSDDATTPVDTLPRAILWPARGEIVAQVGWYRHPIYKDWRFRGGIELKVAPGSPAKAVLPGRVSTVRVDGENGLTVLIEHGQGLRSRYGNLTDLAVRPGQQITAGDVVGRVRGVTLGGNLPPGGAPMTVPTASTKREMAVRQPGGLSGEPGMGILHFSLQRGEESIDPVPLFRD